MSVTHLDSSAALTSNAVSPRAGALVIVSWSGQSGSGIPPSGPFSCADSIGEITFSSLPLFNPFNFAMCQLFYGIASTHQIRQFTVTVQGFGSGNNGLIVDEIDITAVLQTANNSVFGTSATDPFGTTPAASSFVYSSCITFGIHTLTPPAAQTALVSNYQGSTIATMGTAYDIAGSAPISNTWTNSASDYTTVYALEMSQPPAPPPPSTFLVGRLKMH